MAEDFELIEIDEILDETTVADLESRNQNLLEERERQRSALSDLEKTKTDLEKELDAKEEENDRLNSEFHEVQMKHEEDRMELRRLRVRNKELVEDIERLERRMDRAQDENSEVILEILQRQTDLELNLDYQMGIRNIFFEKAVAMMRGVARRMEEGRLDGVDFTEVVDEGLDPSVVVSLQLLADEMAEVKRAFRRNAGGNVEAWDWPRGRGGFVRRGMNG